MGIAETLMRIKERISSSAIKAGKHADDITLVAVSKRIDLQKITEALHAGVTVLGENRIQEAKSKIAELREKAPGLHPEWHLIGHLQKNKVKSAVDLFGLIHSVDSLSLAQEINRQAEKLGKVQKILIQVKLTDEPAKHGAAESDLMDLLEKVGAMDFIKLEGLMTMPPYFKDKEKTRPYFRKLKQLADSAAKRGIPIHELSMGMSNDFEVAIEEGATMVRVGTSIFGEREHN